MALEQAGVQLIAQGSDAFGADMKNATKAVDGFGAETKKAADLVQDAAGRWRTASGRFASDAEKAAAGVETVAPAAKKAGDAAKKAGDDVEKGGRGFDVFGEIVTGALRKVGEFAVESLAKAARATAAFVGDSIDLAGDFEAGMLNFQAVAGRDIDTDGLEEFRDLFIDIGKRLPVSTTEVQQAATEMVKGGIDPAIIAAGGLEQNIQFAAAAMEGDLVAAAEVSSKILGGWADANATAQQKAEFLTHATDQLTKAANASSVDVHELSLGIFNAQGIAKTAGVSFDDLTTTLAALSPRFASSSEAGNSLKNVIARLQPTTKPAIAAMEGLGLITADGANKFYDAQGSFVGFEKASQLLQDSLKGLTDQQKQAVLQTIFGNDAMNAAAGLADLGAAGYQRMADSLANANGVAENAALKQQGFNTALENAKGSIEALQITIGSALLPVLTDLLTNYIAPGINAISDFAEGFFKLLPAIKASDDPLQSFLNALKILVPNALDVIVVVEDIKDAIMGIVGWFNRAGGAGNDLGVVITDLSGIWDKALVVITNVGNGYMAIVNAILPIITRLWDEHGAEISAFVTNTYNSIIEIVNLSLDLYNSIVPPILNAVAGFISDHSSEIQKVLTGAWDIISSLITGTLETIKGVFKVTLAVINGDWEGAWTGIKGIADAQITAIEGVITGFLNLIAGLFDTSLADILATWEHNWNSMVDLISEVGWWEAGKLVVEGIQQGIDDAWNSLMGWFNDKVAGLVDAAMEAIGAASPAKEFMPVGQFAVAGIMRGFQDAWPALTDTVSSLSDDLIGQMADLGSEIQSAIADSFSATASIDRQVAKNLERVGAIADDFRQQFLTLQLRDQQKIAEGFADPKAGAAYFKMASANIFELEDLRNKLNAASNEEERDRIKQQIKLIESAQGAELAAFNANIAAQGNPLQNIVDQIGQLFQGGLPVNDTGPGAELSALFNRLQEILGLIPHRAIGGDVKSGMPYWVGEHGKELFWPTMNGMVSPAASSAQMAARASTTNYNNSATYNMPIYTIQA